MSLKALTTELSWPRKFAPFTCLSDNFGYLIHDPETKATASIDAPEAGPIIKALEREGWTLTDIIITHTITTMSAASPN